MESQEQELIPVGNGNEERHIPEMNRSLLKRSQLVRTGESALGVQGPSPAGLSVPPFQAFCLFQRGDSPDCKDLPTG